MAPKMIHPSRWSPGHPAVGVGQPAGMAKIPSIGRKFVSGGGVLKRMGGVGVEEAAAVGAEQLDGLLGSDRALRDHLPASLQGRGLPGRRDRFWITPWETKIRANTTLIGSRM